MIEQLTAHPEITTAAVFTLGQGFSSALRIGIHIWKRRPRFRR